jgi:hypothetical protein
VVVAIAISLRSPRKFCVSTSCLTSRAGGIDVPPGKEKGKLAVIRLSVPRKVAEALPRFEGVPGRRLDRGGPPHRGHHPDSSR